MTGDSGGDWVVVRRNTCVNPGQVGIGVSGGHYIIVEDNEVRSGQFSWTNTGIYVWDWLPDDGRSCGDHTIRSNVSVWTNREGNSNPFWNRKNCSNLVIEGNSWQ